MNRLLQSRWKHIIRLVPLGLVIGLIFGLIFRDVSYGLLAGGVIALLFGLMLAVRNPA